MYYIGIDPSFRRTGIAVYNADSHVIRLTSSKHDLPKKKTFYTMNPLAVTVADDVFSAVEEITKGGDVGCVVTEYPMQSGQMAPFLFSLGTALIDRWRRISPAVWGVSPSFLGVVHGKRSYRKGESKDLALRMVSKMDGVYLDTGGRKPVHDECEALIFLLYNLVQNGIYTDRLRMFDGLYKDKIQTLYGEEPTWLKRHSLTK